MALVIAAKGRAAGMQAPPSSSHRSPLGEETMQFGRTFEEFEIGASRT